MPKDTPPITARDREELVAIDRCLLLHPLLRESHEALPLLPGLRRLELRAGVRTGQRLIMATGEVDTRSGGGSGGARSSPARSGTG